MKATLVSVRLWIFLFAFKIPNKVEALSRQIVAAIIRVRVAEAIVACLKEAHESLQDAKT